MLWAYVISDLKDEKSVWTFHKIELQKTNQQELRVKKAIKRKVDQLCVKWKVSFSFNSLIDKTDIV